MKLIHRLRRLRENSLIRDMVREHTISKNNLVMPYFVRNGKNVKKPIYSMPGHFQFSIDILIKEVKQLKETGINAIILFGIPHKKNPLASEAYSPNGIIQKAVRAIKNSIPEIIIITDVCLCEYTNHGHCGIVKKDNKTYKIDNDKTLVLLEKIAVSHAKAGADIIAPSGMMDGAVGAIRNALDEANFINIPIMAYSVKYASAFYGPFREAAESPPQFGDRSTYQMDIANFEEAMREIELDIKEGADIIMVKPALAYLDVIYCAKKRFGYPTAAYNVSGEYAMVKAASQNGWLDEKKIVLEILTAIKRAGADIIISCWSKDVAKWIT